MKSYWENLEDIEMIESSGFGMPTNGTGRCYIASAGCRFGPADGRPDEISNIIAPSFVIPRMFLNKNDVKLTLSWVGPTEFQKKYLQRILPLTDVCTIYLVNRVTSLSDPEYCNKWIIDTQFLSLEVNNGTFWWAASYFDPKNKKNGMQYSTASFKCSFGPNESEIRTILELPSTIGI